MGVSVSELHTEDAPSGHWPEGGLGLRLSNRSQNCCSHRPAQRRGHDFPRRPNGVTDSPEGVQMSLGTTGANPLSQCDYRL